MQNLKHVRCVLFDLFHTLVSIEVARPPGPHVYEVLGVPQDAWWRAWTTDADDYVLGRVTLEQFLPARARLASPNATDDQIQQCLAVRPARFRHTLTHVEPETIAGLTLLRGHGYKLGLVSNCGKDEVAAWPESPLAPLLDTAVFSCDVGLKKPDPAIYRLAAQRLGFEPGQCLFVGDGGSDELLGARQAGMTPVLITRHLEAMAPHRIAPARLLAAFAVKTVSQLADLLHAPA